MAQAEEGIDHPVAVGTHPVVDIAPAGLDSLADLEAVSAHNWVVVPAAPVRIVLAGALAEHS